MSVFPVTDLGFAPLDPPPEPLPTGPTGGVAVQVDRVGKSFGDKRVLADLSVSIPAGEFVAIVGRSGCGKSTLLRLVAGLTPVDQGQIRFPGQQGAHPQQVARVMFQEPRLLPWARVAGNVAVGLGRRAGERTTDNIVRRSLASVGLADRADDWPSVLSGGQKQRVALARALVSRPQLLVLDEPLGALDALTRLEMQALIERVWQQEQFTALLVTHDVAEAVALADRILLIEDGQIALDVPVTLPRPRRRGSVALAALEERILRHLLRDDANAPDYII